MKSIESVVLNVAIFGTLLAIFMGITIALWMTRHITNLLGGQPSYIAKIAQHVAQGDLSLNSTSNIEDKGVFAKMKLMVTSPKKKLGLQS